MCDDLSVQAVKLARRIQSLPVKQTHLFVVTKHRNGAWTLTLIGSGKIEVLSIGGEHDSNE